MTKERSYISAAGDKGVIGLWTLALHRGHPAEPACISRTNIGREGVVKI